MNFNFGEVLSRSWQIIWKHKVLWIFGILASCGRGGNSGNSGGGNNNYSGQGPNSNLPPQALQWLQTIEQNLVTYVAIGIAILCLIWIVVIFLNTIGRIGLIRGASQADGGAESLVFGELFSGSLPYFWRMFWLSVIVALPILIVVAGGAVAVIGLAASSGGGNSDMAPLMAMMPLLLCCFCLFIPVMIVIGMIVSQAERAIVLEDLSVVPALSRGWEVFRNNLGPIILMAIILFVIGLIVGFVMAIPVFIIVIPAAITLAANGTQTSTPLILMGIGLCLYIPIALVLGGILTAYTESAWTLTYLRLTKPQTNTPVVLEANA